MVNKVWAIKNKLLKYIDEEIQERGVGRIDVDEMDKMIDMVHHLAESEAACWQATYYRTVTKAMEEGGHVPADSEREGYDEEKPYDGSRKEYMGEGEKEDVIEVLRKEIRTLGPDDRQRFRNQVMTVIGTI